MKHHINELMRIHNAKTMNTYATVEYCKAMGIPMRGTNRETYCRPATCHINPGKPVNVLDVNGVKVIYLFGEKTWFDTEEELIAYRTAYNEQRARVKEHNDLKRQLLDKIEMMTIEEMRVLVAQL